MSARGGRRGDLYLVVVPRVPLKLTANQKRLLEQLAAEEV
jgi:DnaJ-class molecular chaperone